MEELAKRRNEPQRDDLLSYFAHEKLADRYLTDEEVLSYCTNIITGGVDTTTALTSHALDYLHDHPGAKKRLMADLHLQPTAREECVRYFSSDESRSGIECVMCCRSGW